MNLRRRRREAQPQQPELAAFQADLANLRLTLQSDLAAAAAAVDAQQTQIAREILAADRGELAEFSTRRLRELRATTPPPLPRRRPALVMAAAATSAIALLAGGAALGFTARSGTGGFSGATRPATTNLNASLASFRNTVLDDRTDPTAVINAATALRASLLPLLSIAPGNPAAAREAVAVLQAEEQILSAVRPAGLQQVMQEVAALLAQLSAAAGLPAQSPSAIPAIAELHPSAAASAAPTSRPRHVTHKAVASTSTASPTPKASIAPTQPSPQPSPSAAASTGTSPAPAPSNSLPIGVSGAPG